LARNITQENTSPVGTNPDRPTIWRRSQAFLDTVDDEIEPMGQTRAKKNLDGGSLPGHSRRFWHVRDMSGYHELLAKYGNGIWALLIVAAAAFLGLILWMGYTILL
jgi:hypothetical protein